MQLDKLKTAAGLDLRGKRVLVRADLNVPTKDGKVTDATRLERVVPGLEDLAKQLAGSGSEAKARKRIEEKFPTTALARFVFEGDWSGLSSGRLTHCLRPKDLT